jgi:RNA polymerase sigma-70 factor, ECF subfamily
MKIVLNRPMFIPTSDYNRRYSGCCSGPNQSSRLLFDALGSVARGAPMAVLPHHPISQEQTLIRRACSGDTDAFQSLVRPHERAVYLTALSATDSEADTEEVAQEAVLKAFVDLRRFRGDCKFRTWLIEITTTEARRHLQRRGRGTSDSLDPPSRGGEAQYVPRHLTDWRWIPMQALDKKEVREAIVHALLSLPIKYRQALVLRDAQKLSTADTAKILGIGEDGVEKRLLSARLQMRDAIAAGGGTEWVQAASGKVG